MSVLSQITAVPEAPRFRRLDTMSSEARTSLDWLREIGLVCRSKARADLSRACAVLSADPGRAKAAHADVLMRCLAQALDRRPVFFRPGVAEVSFDEAWLLRLSTSLRNGDDASAAFLLHSRVAPHARRNLLYLVRACLVDRL